MRVNFTRRRPRLRWFAVAALSCSALLSVAAVASTTPPRRKTVLILNEVGLAHPASAVVTRELMSQLEGNRDYEVEFYIENLNSTLFGEEGTRGAESSVIQQYQNYKLDAIVAMGPAAIRFLSRVSRSFLPDVPIVFCGSTEEQAGDPKLDGRFTGSWMRLEPAKTLDAARRLFPQTRHVVIVGGTSEFDRGVQGMTKASLDSYPVPLDFTYLTDIEMSSLLDRLRHLPAQTVVLYLSFFRDAAGAQFLNATTALPQVSKAANAPVFGISDVYLGHGVVGGYVVSFAEQGRIAARMVAEIFDGRKVGDIPIVSGPNLYMFDWKQLQRWGLSESALPVGSIVLNREPSLWEHAKWILLTCALALLTLGSLTIYLLYERKQLIQARREQVRLSRILIKAQEEERRRLASELHDDFSQRLALLSLGLETTAELVTESPEEAKQQLHQLLNSAGELGADIHTLSHRLHSSTLERLGLVPGVGAFCKEFTTQQGVEVLFSHRNVPRSVPPETTLCLFRLVQEGLRNVKKHSGASTAKVALEQLNGHLHLSISDDGVGFNPKDALDRQGIGMFSMEERARLIGAQFRIHSKPDKGTRIDIWAPSPKPAPAKPADEVVTRPAVRSA
jgi:signal transduction histidine kinase